MKQITVPIPLEQVEAAHQVWLEFTSLLLIVDRGKFESLLDVLEPLEDRMGKIIFEEWETLMDKAKKNGGAE